MAKTQTGCVWRSSNVVELLERLEDEAPLSEVEQMVLRSRLATYSQVKAPRLPTPECPWCEGEQVDPLDATVHVSRCPNHPARRRYQQLSRVASAMCTRRGLANDLEPQPPLTFPERSRDDDFLHYVRFDEAVVSLGRENLSAQQRKDAAWSIRRDLRSLMHVAERESDPCPWCARVFPLEAFTAHLWSCERHPGFLRASVMADALKERFGEEALLAAVNEDREQQARHQLDELIRACRVYSGDMGWSGDGTYYSKVWSEKPWRRAFHLAAAHARAERQVPMEPRLEALVSSLATLAQQCVSFWNGMRYGDDGRSLIDAEKCRAWEEEVNAAAPS